MAMSFMRMFRAGPLHIPVISQPMEAKEEEMYGEVSEENCVGIRAARSVHCIGR
jgi:hypothetical protein